MTEASEGLYTSLFSQLRNKRIGIYGLGREGRSSLEFLLRHKDLISPAAILCADDQKPAMEGELALQLKDPLVSTCFEEQSRRVFIESDLVLISPGIAVLDQETEVRDGYFRFADWPETAVTSQMDLFLRHAPGHLIGVTGTKGKSTTATVLSALLNAAGCRTSLAGNIGVPIWDVWAEMSSDSYAAIELSSHQLQYCLGAPEIFAITNFYPEHLDHYHSYEAYLNAKLNGLRFCRRPEAAGPRNSREPVFVLNLMDDEVVSWALPLLEKVRPRVITVQKGTKKREIGMAVWKQLSVEDDRLFDLQQQEETLLDLSENVHLLGKHLRYDAALAAACVIAAGLPQEQLGEGLSQFIGLPHRTEKIGVFHGIEFYNDSIATIPQAALLAIEALGERVKTIIVGGMSRGLEFDEFVRELLESSLQTVICLPETGTEIRDLLVRYGAEAKGIKIFMARAMEEAVRLAYANTPEGSICLLSPAASSYNIYKNFEERGDHFRKAVVNYGTGDADQLVLGSR